MSVSVDIIGLKDTIDYFRTLPELSAQAASLAINQVAQRSGMSLARDEIMKQIAFSKDYLSGDRLQVVQFARPDNLVAAIRARKRATSLARFATSGAVGVAGTGVMVKRGQSVYLKQAFLVKLKQGRASVTEDNYNLGLAVRVKAGETIRDKVTAHQSWLVGNAETGGVALLYGPSVDQVFRQVADEIEPGVLELLAAEFFRQFDRIS